MLRDGTLTLSERLRAVDSRSFLDNLLLKEFFL
jgi:hypothetical protein